MKSQIPNDLQENLLNFKQKNLKVLQEWESLKKEADEILFKNYCKKDYYDKCDPIHCTFYKTNECKYPGAISELDSLIKL